MKKSRYFHLIDVELKRRIDFEETCLCEKDQGHEYYKKKLQITLRTIELYLCKLKATQIEYKNKEIAIEAEKNLQKERLNHHSNLPKKKPAKKTTKTSIEDSNKTIDLDDSLFVSQTNQRFVDLNKSSSLRDESNQKRHAAMVLLRHEQRIKNIGEILKKVSSVIEGLSEDTALVTALIFSCNIINWLMHNSKEMSYHLKNLLQRSCLK